MSTIRYFAYGSNMLTAWLQSRCKSARPTGVASVAGFRLAFNKRSKDGSGKAMLTASNDSEACVYGVLYDIDGVEIDALDQAEGRGKGYDRVEDFDVCVDSKVIRVTTYMADSTAIDVTLKPYDWYLDLAVNGAKQHGLPDGYVDVLRATSCISDADPIRKTRREALVILDGLEGRA